MTNLEIITNEAIANGLYTKEQAEEMFANGKILPLFTYAEWKIKGYQVQKGQKASLTCYIWKVKPQSKKDKEENGESLITEFIKVKASFFLPDQVEKIATA